MSNGKVADLVERLGRELGGQGQAGRQAVAAAGAYQLLQRFAVELDDLDAGDRPRVDDDFGWMVQIRSRLLQLFREAFARKEAHQRAADAAGLEAGEQEWLAQGLTEEQAYDRIIGSSMRSNNNIRPKGMKE